MRLHQLLAKAGCYKLSMAVMPKDVKTFMNDSVNIIHKNIEQAKVHIDSLIKHHTTLGFWFVNQHYVEFPGRMLFVADAINKVFGIFTPNVPKELFAKYVQDIESFKAIMFWCFTLDHTIKSFGYGGNEEGRVSLNNMTQEETEALTQLLAKNLAAVLGKFSVLYNTNEQQIAKDLYTLIMKDV